MGQPNSSRKGSSLGIIVYVHAFWKSRRSCYRKAMIESYLVGSIFEGIFFLDSFFRALFKIFASSTQQDRVLILENRVLISKDRVFTNKDSIIVLKLLIFQSHFFFCFFTWFQLTFLLITEFIIALNVYHPTNFWFKLIGFYWLWTQTKFDIYIYI